MQRQRYEARHAAPITEVFCALAAMLARSRWASGHLLGEPDGLPRIGQLYVQRRGGVVRRGRVVECLRPVILTLHESLLDPPCRVRLRLRWRLEPIDDGSLVLLEANYELNRPASLNRRRWDDEIRGHCERLLRALSVRVNELISERYTDTSGQKSGSSSMTDTNTTAVNGKPTFK